MLLFWLIFNMYVYLYWFVPYILRKNSVLPMQMYLQDKSPLLLPVPLLTSLMP